EDFTRVPGVQALTLLHEDCPPMASRWPHRVCQGDEEACFRSLAKGAEHTLVIAPEFDRLLETRCRWVMEEGGRLLCSAPEAVRLAGDKWLLARLLQEYSIPTPPTIRLEEVQKLADFPLVLKPRHGVGSLATFLVRHAEEVPPMLARFREECPGDEPLLQSFVGGQPASAAFLIGPGQRLPLLPAAQHLSEDGRFHYRGGSLPLPPCLAERALRLAERTLATVPGLQGYAGVDVVLGNAEDGSRDYVIEVNPRLTTSYVGLRALAATN